MFFVSCVSHAFASVHSCLVVTDWERADLLTLVGDIYCIFCSFPLWDPRSGVVQNVSFPDLCSRSYLKSLKRQGLSEPKFYGEMVYKLNKIVGSYNF